MPTLQSLSRQHDHALQLTLRLINLMAAHRPHDDPYPIALQLARWVNLLRAHLASEDEWLYPAMIASRDAAAAATASAFQADMGHLAQGLEDFNRRWSCSAAIGADFGGFHRDALELFAAFDRRIAREDRDLYPLARASFFDALTQAA